MTFPPRGLAAYKNVQVQSRTPLELVVMLYDGALRFMDAGREAILRKDIPARHEAFSRLLAITSELQNTLNMEAGGSIAVELDRLYTYVNERILDSAMRNSVEPLDEARKVLVTLRDGWQQIATQPPPSTVGQTR